MADAKRDQNNVTTMLGTLDSTGASLVLIKVNPDNHGLKIDDASTGTDHGPTVDLRDANFVTGLMGVSSETTTVNGVDYVEGVTPVPIYATAAGSLLIDSN